VIFRVHPYISENVHISVDIYIRIVHIPNLF